jgi:hypothetical protein
MLQVLSGFTLAPMMRHFAIGNFTLLGHFPAWKRRYRPSVMRSRRDITEN